MFDVCAAMCMSAGLVWFTLADSKITPNFDLTGTVIFKIKYKYSFFEARGRAAQQESMNRQIKWAKGNMVRRRQTDAPKQRNGIARERKGTGSQRV